MIERRIEGVRIAPLGTMYDPMYFYRGFAIHGSPSVPPWPASHGCIRITRADAAWMIANVPDGMPVHVYGGTPHLHPVTRAGAASTAGQGLRVPVIPPSTRSVAPVT